MWHVCVEFNYDRLRIDKALGNFRKSDNNNYYYYYVLLQEQEQR